MPLPLTVSCFSKIQIGFTFLVPAHLGITGKMAVKRVCVCVYDAVSTFHDDNIWEMRSSTLCTSCLELTTETVLSSDSVAVIKSTLKTFLFSQAFSSSSAH